MHEELKVWIEEGLEARWMVRERVEELTTTTVVMADMFNAKEMLGELRWIELRDKAHQRSMLRVSIKLEQDYLRQVRWR